MATKPENLDHFLFNSDFPTDKIVWVYENERTLPASGIFNFYIVNSLPYKDFPIFVKAAFTFDNWQTSYPAGLFHTRPNENDGGNISWTTYDGQGAVYVMLNFQSHGNQLVKYRFWGVQREDMNIPTDYGKTAGISHSAFILSSDKNYPRLYKDGVANGGDTITHNLGKIPYVDFWYSLDTDTSSLLSYWSYSPIGGFTQSATSWPGIIATDKTITFKKMRINNEDSAISYYYRIYA